MAIPASGADPDKWLTLNGKPLSFLAASDNQQAGVKDFDYHFNQFRATRFTPDRLVIQAEGEDAPVVPTAPGLWEWRPRSYAGVYQFQVTAPGLPVQTARVRVFPTQISQARYDQMLEEISSTAFDLLFSLKSPASARVKTARRERQSSALREFYLLQPIIYKLTSVMANIRRNPHRALAELTEQRQLHEVSQYAAGALPSGGPMVKMARAGTTRSLAYLPLNWSVQQQYLTYDTYENRLLKHFVLRQVPPRLKSIQRGAQLELARRRKSLAYKQLNNWQDDETVYINKLVEILKDIDNMVHSLKSWGNEPFFKGVKELSLKTSPTQVLQKNPYYNRFYGLYLNFQKELRFSLNTDKYLTALSLRKLAELYEIWSVFHLTDIIINTLMDYGFEITSDALFYQVEKDNFQFEVRKDVTGIVMERDNIQVKFRYEPIYKKMVGNMSGLVSVDYTLLTPDLAIEIYSANQPRAVLIFDAKYRTNENNGKRIFLEEDVDKVRKYRDLIRYQNPSKPVYNARPPKIVTSSYVIYPGDVIDHEQYEAEVGALPLIPGKDKDLKEQVFDAVEDIINKAGEFANLNILDESRKIAAF